MFSMMLVGAAENLSLREIKNRNGTSNKHGAAR
jgi:hypothetical protein